MIDILENKVLGVLKGIGTIILYFIVSLFCSYLFRNYILSDNIFVASLFQVLTYVILLLIIGGIYHKRLIHDFKNFKKEYVGIALKNWIIGLGAMFIANIIISSIAGGIASNEEANRTLLGNYPVSSFISMVFLGPGT